GSEGVLRCRFLLDQPLGRPGYERMKAQILKRFEDEIMQLERELKTELPKEIQRSRKLGDLREKAEYQADKERQESLTVRIAMVQKRVAEVSLINLDNLPHDRIGFG